MAHNAHKQYEHVIYSLFHAAHVHLESGMTVKTLFNLISLNTIQ